MKKTTTILCLGIALCMLGCSDDDDQVTTTSTVPFSLTASLSPRSSDAEDTGILQGNWDANSQLAVIKTGSSGVPFPKAFSQEKPTLLTPLRAIFRHW